MLLGPALDAATAVLERTNAVMAGTLLAVYGNRDVARYLATATQPGDSSLSGSTPYAAVLLPLLMGPHAGRNLRFFPSNAVEELAYVRAVTTAQTLYAADRRMPPRDIGALRWFERIASDLPFEHYDGLLDAQYVRHVHGARIDDHNTLESLADPGPYHAPLLAKFYNRSSRPL